MYQLKVKSLSKAFDKSLTVLDSISFSVSKGEFLVVLGASGCGKTTLLRIVSGLEQPDSGEIYIAQKNITNTEPKDRDVAMVFQNYALYPHMSVYNNLAFALRIRKISAPDLDKKVKSTAQLLGLENHLMRKPGQLSGGQCQRVALGRAIVRNPLLFLFDEPLSNLDARLRMRMRTELLTLHRKIEATSLYVTHDQTEAMSMADRILILNQGTQIGPEKPRNLYDNPPDTFVAGFLGNPPMNLVEASTDVTGTRINIEHAVAISSGCRLPSDTAIIYGFRPEDCTLSSSGDIPVEVDCMEDAGKEFIISLTGPGKSRINCLSGKKYSSGEKLHLEVEKACYFDPATNKRIEIDD